MSLLLPLIRTHLRENFMPYSSAAGEMGKIEGACYLNANENPYPFDGLAGLERYDVQQPPALLQAMATAYNIAAPHIIATRGSDESIDLIIRMFCADGRDAILTCPPTFGMYGVYGHLQGARHVTVPLIEEKGTFYLDAENIIKTACDSQQNIKIIFLCCPNAPSGDVFDPDVIEEIISGVAGHAAVVVDEAYIDFATQDSFASKLAQHKNLIILRTLSKIHALAGERVGATLCDDTQFMSFMRGCLAPYPLPKSVTKNAVEALRQAQDKQSVMVENIRRQRKLLEEAFTASDKVAHVYPSQTNFIMVKFKSYDQAQQFLKTAHAAQIILRDISAKPDTKNCLRISVGTAEVNRRLMDLLFL